MKCSPNIHYVLIWVVIFLQVANFFLFSSLLFLFFIFAQFFILSIYCNNIKLKFLSFKKDRKYCLIFLFFLLSSFYPALSKGSSNTCIFFLPRQQEGI